MWFEEAEDHRIVSWRNWRTHLNSLPRDQIPFEVAKTWSHVPTVMHLLAPDQIDSWPNPWQLITDNYYCDIAINLGMFYSLALVESTKFDDLCIKIYRTNDGWLNLSSIDQGKYVLNYSHGEIVNMSQVEETINEKRLLYQYSYIDLEHKFK